MTDLPEKKQSGNILYATEVNSIVDAVRKLLNIRGFSGIRFTVSPSGIFISRDSVKFRTLDPWLAEIQTEGPASEADYTDPRYWVKSVYCNLNSGDQTTELTWTDVLATHPKYKYTTAINLSEIKEDSHCLEANQVVVVESLRDLQDPAIVHFYFSSMRPPVWAPYP